MVFVSIVGGILALVGFVILLLNWANPAWIFWVSAALSVISTLTGFTSRKARNGAAGLTLGVVGVLVAVFMLLFMDIGPVESGPVETIPAE